MTNSEFQKLIEECREFNVHFICHSGLGWIKIHTNWHPYEHLFLLDDNYEMASKAIRGISISNRKIQCRF